MSLQTSTLTREHRARTVEAEAKRVPTVQQIMDYSSHLFRLFVAALRESRRREAARLLRRHQHLIDE